MDKVLTNVVLFALMIVVPNIAWAQTEKWIDIHNLTGTSISTVRFSETNSLQETRDVLGNAYINPGDTYRVRIRSHACMIDMRVKYVNDASHFLRFDICKSEHVDAKPSGLVVAY